MSKHIHRRNFLKSSALAGLGFWAAGGVTPKARALAANEKMNVAFVGVGGMGGGNLKSVAAAGENVVGLCDIDEGRLNDAGAQHPKAQKFVDFREMYDKLGKGIDAVVVSTPDHTHAIAGLRAMKMGKHLYCEKPLTYCVWEARQMRQTAAEQKVATCMGNRGTASDQFRSGVELLQQNVLGDVKEVHVWTNRPGSWWSQGIDRPPSKKPPENVNWDLWIGPAPYREYHDKLHPFHWRGWIDFGTGALGDMACHTLNLAYMGLKLGYPTSIVAESGKLNGETYPLWSTITYEFPARGELPPVKVTWYDGDKDGKRNLPYDQLKGLKASGSGSLVLGDKGKLYSPGDYGTNQQWLTPDGNPLRVEPPTRTLPRAPQQNNYLDWIRACKGGVPALGQFDYAALLTEAVLLGDVALRLGEKVEYDAEGMKADKTKGAAKLLKREYRDGWTI